MQTFYWHDYETWGINPSQDRPSQFAGIRTDHNFNIIGEPLVQFCKPPQDLLPHPDACLTHKVTPQQAEADGILEYQFISAIHRELSAPETCGVGYNSVRFDDEFTRYMLYRNFYDPYQREYQNGNSRWDIIDMVRACYALRPEGIQWFFGNDGKPSFKLEHITRVNGLSHDNAHDALSDVYATIAVARLIKQKQPKLFEYLFKLRDKREVFNLLNLSEQNPVLHISSMFSSQHGCAALVMPLSIHPVNKNEIICYDLSVDPTPLLELNVEQVRERIFSSRDGGSKADRIPLKTIRANRCPVIVTEKILDDATAQRLKIDRSICQRNYKKLRAEKELSKKIRDVFIAPKYAEITDPEQMLYSGGFFSETDRATMLKVRQATGDTLAHQKFSFEDKRLPELLFRYRARNFQSTLTEDERNHWAQFCYQRLTNSAAGASIVLDEYRHRLLELSIDASHDEKRKEILQQLSLYAEGLVQ